MGQEKRWIIRVVLLIVTLFIVFFVIHRLINGAFESTGRIIEEKVLAAVPAEYCTKVEADFDAFILAFKKNKLDKGDLDSLSMLVKQANEDKIFTREEAQEIVTFIETITPGLK